MRAQSGGGKSVNERAARLREALRRRGVKKLYGLALDLDVDQSTISRWTTNGAMSLDHAAALCSALSISLDWLIFGNGGMDAQPVGAVSEGSVLAGRLEMLEPEVLASFKVIVQALIDNRRPPSPIQQR